MRQLVKNRRREPETRDLRTDLKLPTRSLDVVLAIDASRSMAPHGKLLYAKKAAVGLALAATRRGDRVGILSFSDYASDVVDPSGGVDQAFVRRIADLRPLNSTNVEDALRLASSTLQRSQVGQKHVILITDGVPTSCTELFHSYQYAPYRYYYGSYFREMSIKAAYSQARRLVDNGITISTICVERDEHVDRDFCTSLSRIGKGQPYFLKDERDLPKTTLREYNRARNS
jgi:Mg-chelatase subunit ChlD